MKKLPSHFPKFHIFVSFGNLVNFRGIHLFFKSLRTFYFVQKNIERLMDSSLRKFGTKVQYKQNMSFYWSKEIESIESRFERNTYEITVNHKVSNLCDNFESGWVAVPTFPT